MNEHDGRCGVSPPEMIEGGVVTGAICLLALATALIAGIVVLVARAAK